MEPSKKSTYIIAAAAFVILAVAIYFLFIFQRGEAKIKSEEFAGEKIERGATGTDVNTKDEKYKKSMLLGTASRGTRSPDTGVTDGVLTMHMTKGDIEYLSESKWDLFEAGATVRSIADRDGDFPVENLSLGKNYWIIIADTV